MSLYLLGVVEPVGPAPDPELLEPVMAAVAAIDQELRDAGDHVFAGGLAQPAESLVVRAHDGDVVHADGPYVESTEHLGGFTIVDVASREEAVSWADRFARAIGLPIEVRPFRR